MFNVNYETTKSQTPKFQIEIACYLANIAKQKLASTNQNPRSELRREAPQLTSWILCPKQNLLCYISKKRRSAMLRQDSGFSLIESLVAVVVVSILIVSIAPMVALSTSARVNARRIDQATQAARSYIDAVRGGAIDTTNFPDDLINNVPNAQNQYTFEAIAVPTSAILSLDSTTVRGIKVDANGNGFSTSDPQDLFVQPMRSGSKISTELSRQGFWLAVRVYRADALLGATALKKGTEPECGISKTPFSTASSITCPIVTMRSQVLPTVSSNNLEEIRLGIGSAPP